MRNEKSGIGKTVYSLYSLFLAVHSSFLTPHSPLRVVFGCLFFIVVCTSAGAQNGSYYLMPQTVYVGDRAVLTVPLPPVTGFADIVLDPLSSDFPSSPDMDIHRIVLENRPSSGRLVIEFSAFVTGLLEFPPIEIGSRSFSGIKVEISSILQGPNSTVLSEPLPPVSIPGTSLFVYGTMAGTVLFLLIVLFFVFWGRRNFSGMINKWKRLHLISGMARMEKRLAKYLLHGDKWLILDRLSLEFRNFLSLFSGKNCRAMTAREFGQSLFPEIVSGMQKEWNNGFLMDFFKRCDDLRFGGGEILLSDISALLVELRQFLVLLNNAVRKKSKDHRV